mmetsp:Transcript_14598/g.44548  ORF Transcript_14598/g.44548 Transcript_14598/m.44548 type:complete len:200 (-) Transcript_14598:314-913(-)
MQASGCCAHDSQAFQLCAHARAPLERVHRGNADALPEGPVPRQASLRKGIWPNPAGCVRAAETGPWPRGRPHMRGGLALHALVERGLGPLCHWLIGSLHARRAKARRAPPVLVHHEARRKAPCVRAERARRCGREQGRVRCNPSIQPSARAVLVRGRAIRQALRPARPAAVSCHLQGHALVGQGAFPAPGGTRTYAPEG